MGQRRRGGAGGYRLNKNHNIPSPADPPPRGKYQRLGHCNTRVGGTAENPAWFSFAQRPCPPPLRRYGWGNVVGVGTADVIRSGNTQISFRPTHPHAATTNTLVGQWGWVARADAICSPHVLCRAPHPYDDAGGATSLGWGRPT
ncbi:MAG: hypothetical protein OT477_02915 [Chloroflexi bacterium]|nr:hypothetical protein [Chloroflexota bacterium]